MDNVASIVSAAVKAGSNAPPWLVAVLLIAASLAVVFAAAVIWDFTGRITTVRSESGKVEINLNTRDQQVRQ